MMSPVLGPLYESTLEDDCAYSPLYGIKYDFLNIQPALAPCPAGDESYRSFYLNKESKHAKLFEIIARRHGVSLKEDAYPSKKDYVEYVDANPELESICAAYVMDDYLTKNDIELLTNALKVYMKNHKLVYTCDALTMYLEWKNDALQHTIEKSMSLFCKEHSELFKQTMH